VPRIELPPRDRADSQRISTQCDRKPEERKETERKKRRIHFASLSSEEEEKKRPKLTHETKDTTVRCIVTKRTNKQ
jgi:hypothetical protein